jgi:hypothetical protein
MVIIHPVSGVSFIRLEHHTNMDTSIFIKGVTEWTVAFLLSSFTTTIYSTGNLTISCNLSPGLITYKLISTQIKLRQHGVSTSGSFTHRITRIIVESAALYSLNHTVLYEVKSQVENTPSYLVSLVPNWLNVLHEYKYINRKQVWQVSPVVW